MGGGALARNVARPLTGAPFQPAAYSVTFSRKHAVDDDTESHKYARTIISSSRVHVLSTANDAVLFISLSKPPLPLLNELKRYDVAI